MVFAAKAVSVGSGAFQWVAVGNSKQGTLDRTGAHQAGICGVSATSEAGCSLNADPSKGAEDPRVAAGTMDPEGAAVPWVVWSEDVSGVQRIFVSRLVGTGAGARFAIVNGGAPISSADGDATRPDITFSGNTPYVTWRPDARWRREGLLRPLPECFESDVQSRRVERSADAEPRRPTSASRSRRVARRTRSIRTRCRARWVPGHAVHPPHVRHRSATPAGGHVRGRQPDHWGGIEHHVLLGGGLRDGPTPRSPGQHPVPVRADDPPTRTPPGRLSHHRRSL